MNTWTNLGQFYKKHLFAAIKKFPHSYKNDFLLSYKKHFSQL